MKLVNFSMSVLITTNSFNFSSYFLGVKQISLCIVCPLLVPFIKFTVELNSKKGEDNRQPVGEKSANSENDTRSKSLSPQHQNRVTPNNLPDDDGDGVGFIRAKSRRKHHNLINKFNKVRLFDFRAENINIFYAVYYFYQAPVTKFLCNIVSKNSLFIFKSPVTK